MKSSNVSKVIDICVSSFECLGYLRKKKKKEYVPVNVVFSIGWQIVVDYQRHLLNVDTTSQQIGGDQYTAWTGTEFLHNNIARALIHVTVLKRNEKKNKID